MTYNGKVQVKRNNRRPEVLTNWGQEFVIEFEIMVKRKTNGVLNVFQLTKGDENDRIPSLNIQSSNEFLFSSFVNGNRNFKIRYKFELQKTHNVKISQNDSGLYCIEINGVVHHCTQNNTPMNFDKVFVYVSNPWNKAFSKSFGELKNLKISGQKSMLGKLKLEIYIYTL